jgi:hypothetical protein
MAAQMDNQAAGKQVSVSLRLDRLVGRVVYTMDNRRLGRLQEFRVERRGHVWVVTEYVIGAAGLMERLGLGVRLVLGLERPVGYVARWDQVEFSNPYRPTLTCAAAEVRRQ